MPAIGPTADCGLARSVLEYSAQHKKREANNASLFYEQSAVLSREYGSAWCLRLLAVCLRPAQSAQHQYQ